MTSSGNCQRAKQTIYYCSIICLHIMHQFMFGFSVRGNTKKTPQTTSKPPQTAFQTHQKYELRHCLERAWQSELKVILVLLNPTLPYPTLPYPTLPYPTLPYPIPYPTLPHPTLPLRTSGYDLGFTLLYHTTPTRSVKNLGLRPRFYRTLPYPTLTYP